MTTQPVRLRWKSREFPPPDKARLRSYAVQALRLSGCAFAEKAYLQIDFLDSAAMARANHAYLNHVGDTDVITFDFRAEAGAGDDDFSDPFAFMEAHSVEIEPFGHLLICPAVALRQSLRRKRRSYSAELALYIVHGILHLCGEDDIIPAERAHMRRAEQRLLCRLRRAGFEPESLFPLTD